MDSVKKKIRAFFGRITEESVHRAVCLTVIVACLMFVVINNTTVLSLAADDEDQVSDYSFYKLSSIASSAFSSSLVDDADGPETALETYFGSLNPYTGGGIIAFPDDSDRGIFGMFVNFISSSSATKSYSSFGDDEVYADGSTYENSTNPFGAYITLGATLSDLGLDQTGSAAETITFFSVRNMIGSLVMLAYMGAQSIAVIFEFCIGVLQALNPFRFFKSVTTPSAPGVTTNSWTAKLTNIGSGTGPLNGAFDGVIGGVATFIATFYEYLYVAGIVILAIFFAYTMVSFFNPKMAKSRSTLLKNYIIRGLFVIGGLALLGGTYTTMLNWVSDSMSGTNSAASKIVASTFVDFEGWVYKGMPTNNLAIPYKVCDGQILADDGANVQGICYQMNKEVCGDLPSTTAASWADMSSTISTIQTGTNSTVAQTLDDDDFGWVLSLLNRYVGGDKVTSADYESVWKSKYWAYDDADEMAALAEFIEYSSSVSEITTSNDISTDRYSDDDLTIDGQDVDNPFGAPSYSGSSTGTDIDVTAGYNGRFYDRWEEGTLGTVKLSPMSIYNYLNTRFDNSSMVLYSNHKSISQFTRESHYAVNLVGSGINSVIILGTCLSLLITYMVLGFVYGFGMIINNIKRGMRMIIAVPGAMLGSLHSIAKVVSYVVLMLVEILAHIFMYCLTTEMLYALATSFTTVMQTTMNNLLGATATAMLSPIIGIVIIVFLWTFTIKCIQLKKPIIAMFEEMADNVVQKFIVGSTAAERRVMAQQAGGGAAASAGGAAAGAAAGKKGAKGVTMGDFGKATALNAVTGGVGGNLYLHNKNAKAKMEAKKAKGQAEAQLLMSQMGIGGGTSSALEEERNLDQVAAAKRENKKTAAKETAAGAAKATLGAVEVAAGAYTGNAALAAKGAKDLAQGSMDMNNASINKDNNDAAAMAQGAQANGSALVSAKGGDKGLTAQKNNTSVEKFDVGKEAIATAGAVVGGNLGSAAGNGSISMADAKSLAGAAKAVKSGDYAGAAKSALEVAGKNGSTPQAITANGTGTTTVTTEETIEELTKSNFKSSSQKSEVGGKKLERNDVDLVGGTSQRQIESSEDVTVKAGTNVQVDGTVTEVGSANVQVPQQRESSKSFEATENATVNKKVLVGSNTTFEQVGGNDNGTPVFSKNQSTVVGAQEEHTVNRQVSYRENVIDNGPTGSDNHPRNLNTSGNYTTSEVHDEHTEQRRVTRKTVTTVQNVGDGQVQSGSGMTPQHTSETVDNQHTTYVRQYDDVQVQKSGTSGGGKNLGGTMGNFAAQNTQQDVVQTNTVNVRQDEHVNYQQGSRTQSGYRNNRSNGDFNDSFDSRQVTDTINVQQNERINYQKGGSQVTGKMNNGFGAQIAGEHRSETVVDTVDVERRTEYKEHHKDAPRKAKPGSTDDTI